MRHILIVLLLLSAGLGLNGQALVQHTGANGAGSVSFPATTAGNLNVIAVVAGHYTNIAGLTATDSKNQNYKLDGPCATPAGDGFVCFFYVCSGVGGVTSATVNGLDGVAAINFLEASGIVSTNCAGATSTAAGTVAPCQIYLTPDQPDELAVVAFATAGDANAVNGSATYTNQQDFGADPLATVLTTSTAPIWAETDSGSPGCVNTDNENPNGYDAAFVAFRTQAPGTVTCPANPPVPAIASCSYSSNLGSQAVGSTGSTQTVSVTIAAGTTVGSIGVLTTGLAGKDFASASGGTCTASTYASATTCQVKVSFSPLSAGLRRGAVLFTDALGNVLSSVPLYGTGTGPQVGYGPGGAQTNVGSGYSSPMGVAVDAAGNLYVADETSVLVDDPNPSFYAGAVYKVASGGVKTQVGSPFAAPVSVALDGAGNMYVADINQAAVARIPPSGIQTTIGSGFNTPTAVATDGAGNVYVADTGRVAVYKITPGGTQTTIGSGFSIPSGLAADAAGNVYVADAGVPAVYKITPGGTQTTVGSGYTRPQAVTVDASGTVFVADAGTDTLLAVTPGGTLTTIATGLNDPTGLAVDGSGNLYVADYRNTRVLKIDRADAPVLAFATTNAGSTSTDSPKTVQVQNIGNAALLFSGVSFPQDFPEYGSDGNPCTGSTSLSPAQLCDVPVTFHPVNGGALSEHVTLTDNTLNAAGAMQSITVTGTATGTNLGQTITFTPPAAVTYGTAAINLAADASATSGLTVSFQLISGPASLSGAVLTITGKGSVVVKATQAGNGTFSAAAPVQATITVSPAVLKVTAFNYTRVYDTALPTTFAYSITGFVNSDTLAVVSGAPSLSTTGSSLSTPGAYPITPAAGTLAAANYTFQFVAGTLTITPAVLKVTAYSYTRVYGTALPTTWAYSITGFVNGDTIAKVSGTPSFATAATSSSGAGAYPITPALGTLSAADYTFQFAAGTLTITQAVLKVTAYNYSRYYRQALPASYAYSITGFVNGDSAATAVSGAPTITTTAVLGSPAGMYPITPTLGTLTSANYTFVFAPGTLTITSSAVLTVTPYSYTRVYGSAPPTTFAYSITGFVGGDTISVVSGLPSITTTGTSASPAGSYPITAALGSLAAANYTFQFVPGALTITPAVLKVTPFNYNRVYGTGPPSTFAYSLTGFLNGDPQSVVSGTPSISTTETPLSGAGSYPITAALGTLTAANYTFQFVPGTLTVLPAVLKVTAFNYTRVVGAALPSPFAYSVTGFLNGDTAASSVTGTPGITTPAFQGSPAGTYPINVGLGTLASANYTFTFVNGTLTITSPLPPGFTLVQKCHAPSNASNTCTFAHNVTPGDLVIGGAVIDNTIQSTGVVDGAGNAFTLSPNSPCVGGSVTSHGWVFYQLSSPGGANTNTIVFEDNDGPDPNDYVDELWGYEFAVTGGSPVFDTDTNGCGSSMTSNDPSSTLTLSSSPELAYFVSYAAGFDTGVGPPWTVGTATPLGNIDGYDTTASGTITTAVTPANQGWGINMAMAIKIH
jgi:sugar lactone lactonase YvrE